MYKRGTQCVHARMWMSAADECGMTVCAGMCSCTHGVPSRRLMSAVLRVPDVCETEVNESLGRTWRGPAASHLIQLPRTFSRLILLLIGRPWTASIWKPRLPSASPCQQDGDRPLKPDTLKALYIFSGAAEHLHRSLRGRQQNVTDGLASRSSPVQGPSSSLTSAL